MIVMEINYVLCNMFYTVSCLFFAQPLSHFYSLLSYSRWEKNLIDLVSHGQRSRSTVVFRLLVPVTDGRARMQYDTIITMRRLFDFTLTYFTLHQYSHYYTTQTLYSLLYNNILKVTESTQSRDTCHHITIQPQSQVTVHLLEYVPDGKVTVANANYIWWPAWASILPVWLRNQRGLKICTWFYLFV